MIFVNIASYRDQECRPTVEHLYQHAAKPDEVSVGLVLQDLPGDNLLFAHDGMRVLHVNALQSKGACWARNRANLLWGNEDYVLQIDSHMRFAPGWDETLVAQLALCNSAKPLLTTYPPGYELTENGFRFASHSPVHLVAKCFEPSGVLSQQGIDYNVPQPTPRPTAFVAAGFLFGRAAWIHEVPYDPWLYFNGEEITLSARLWTHGWDFFGPTEAIIWHLYGRADRPQHFEDNLDWNPIEVRSIQRVRHLLGMEQAPADALVDITTYSLGRVRTLEQYEQFSGINFKQRTIADFALSGEFATWSAPRPVPTPAHVRRSNYPSHRHVETRYGPTMRSRASP